MYKFWTQSKEALSFLLAGKMEYKLFLGKSFIHKRHQHRFLSVPIILSIVLCFVIIPKAESQESSSRFVFDLYQKCAAESSDRNIIISPFSVATALTLLSQGAQGNTFDQIVHGLHLEANKMAIANRFATNYDLLMGNAGRSTLLMANRLYLKQGHQIQQTFLDVAVNKFKSGVENINFAYVAAAASTINSFVEQKTNKQIKDLFDSYSFNASTSMVLVSAIYFKSSWAQRFSTMLTAPGNFYVDEVNTVTVDYMNNTEFYNNAAELNGLDASAVELKYENSNISFVVVLPNKRTGLPALEASLVNYNFSEIIKQMEESEITVKLPKFKIEYQIELTSVLKKMGMTKMFEDNADFGGLVNSPASLKVSEFIHKAFIEVNEEGSEVAAAKVFGGGFPVIFNADRPFLYYILDTITNTVLFAGRYTKFA